MFILQVSFQRQSNGLKGRKACWSNHTISKYSPWFIICSALRDLQCLIISNDNNNGYYFSCSIYTLYWHLHDKKKKKEKRPELKDFRTSEKSFGVLLFSSSSSSSLSSLSSSSASSLCSFTSSLSSSSSSSPSFIYIYGRGDVHWYLSE